MSGRSAGESGFALLLAVVVLLLVSVALAMIATTLSLELQAVRSEVDRIKLSALVDAAVEHTMAELGRRRAYSGLSETELGEGKIWSSVKRLSGRRLRIEAGAAFGAQQRFVEVTLREVRGRLTVETWRRVPRAEAKGRPGRGR